MSLDVVIGDRSIGESHPPFVIAEMSGNHNQSLERALAIVDAAADSGADAVKLQTYTADTMTLDLPDGDFLIDDPTSPWHGYTLYALYASAHTPWEWHQAIFDRARSRNLLCFSTPFDTSAVRFLEALNVPAYKIASFESIDTSLIRAVADTGKPIILSTGMATLAEIDRAVRTIRSRGNDQIVLLKCTSTYPASPLDSHLRTIPHLRESFATQVGLSDHTLGLGAAVASVALGATVIEKHLTLDRAEGGVDSAFSLEPHEMERLTEECRRAWEALGEVSYGPKGNEAKSLRFRRSLYVVRDVEAGEPLTRENVRAIRPGFGLSPDELDRVLGLLPPRPLRAGTPLSWALLREDPHA